MSEKFKKILDDVDRQVEEINAVKKVQDAKEKRIQKILKEQEQKIKSLKAEEERVVRKAKTQNKFMYAFLFSVAGLALIPLWKKDPVNFWFYVIVIVCASGIVAAKQMRG